MEAWDFDSTALAPESSCLRIRPTDSDRRMLMGGTGTGDAEKETGKVDEKLIDQETK